ncbi:MAG TPA: hypothetical protein PK098_06990 [Phycisphaerales bacterium]|nr:hypothetical protein [Phycisphaerales bacterium]
MRRRIHRRGLTNGQTALIISIVVIVLLALSCFGLLLMGGIMLPALGQARQAAQSMKSMIQLQSLEMAQTQFVQDFPDQQPTFENLVANNYITVEMTQSPFGPVPDGGGDYWLLLQRSELEDAADAVQVVIGYDRAMYASHYAVAVLFADGSTNLLSIADFEQLVATPPNDRDAMSLPNRTR